jgi:hypothetical protein
LPGFSVDLPSVPGIKTVHELLDYQNGQVSLGGTIGGPLVVLVQWNPGDKLDAKELEVLIGTLGETEHAPSTLVPGLLAGNGAAVDTVRIDDRKKGRPALISQIPCGGRNILVASIHGPDPVPMHRRIVGSLRCHPEPSAEATLHTTVIPLSLALPGWVALSRDQNQLMLSDGDKSVLMLQPMAASTPTEVLSALGPVLDRAFPGALHVGEHSGDRVPLSGKLGGETVVGYARLIACPATKILVFELSSDEHAVQRLDTHVASARCLGPGEPAPSWPDAK